MAMKIASRKKKIPSIAKAIPKASPKGSIIPGHSSPNSKERTVPLTAPTANSTATALDQRRARRSASASPLLRPRYSAISITAGKATPRQARTMWKPSVNAIWLRAASRFDPASASSGVKSGIESPSGAGGRGDAEPLELTTHRLGQGVETAHRPHHDGQLDDPALGVEAQQVDALQIAVADARVEDQGGHVSVLELVPVAEVLEDVQCALDEDRRDDRLALVWLEDDGAPEDDALGEGLGGDVPRRAGRHRAPAQLAESRLERVDPLVEGREHVRQALTPRVVEVGGELDPGEALASGGEELPDLARV